MNPLKIAGLSGSLRTKSYNTALLRVARTVVPEGARIDIVEIGNLPLYNEDLRQNGRFPDVVQAIIDEIQSAGAILFSTPEYNYSIPGVLKNAIDWLSRAPSKPFAGKAIGIVGATMGTLGTVRAQVSLRTIMISMNVFPVNVPEVMISSAAQKFDENLGLVDQAALDLLKKHLEELVRISKQLSR